MNYLDFKGVYICPENGKMLLVAEAKKEIIDLLKEDSHRKFIEKSNGVKLVFD